MLLPLPLLCWSRPALAASSSQAAYDSAELKCRSSIAKTFTKAVSAGQKSVSLCHKDRGSGKVGGATDCNVLDNTNADAKGKFAKAATKLTASVQKSCIDSGIDADVLTEYTSCPEPCGTDLALPNPMTSYTELSSCLACTARETAESYGAATQGLPAGVPFGSPADQSCHAAIGKGYGKLLKTILKDRTKCQNSAEKDWRRALERHDLPHRGSEGQDRAPRRQGGRRDRLRRAPARRSRTSTPAT